MSNFGYLHYLQGVLSTAQTYLEHAIALMRKMPNNVHEEFANALNNYALLQHVSGDFNVAKQYLEEAMDMQKKVLGEGHSYYTIHLENFSILMADMEYFDVAERSALRALSLQKKILGDQHPQIASSMRNLGVLYYKIADLEKAVHYLSASVRQLREDKNSSPIVLAVTAMCGWAQVYKIMESLKRLGRYWTRRSRFLKTKPPVTNILVGLYLSALSWL